MEDLILLVEDDETFGQTLKVYFEDNDLPVKWVKNGETAISQFRGSHPRLILLDVNLPDMDGFEVATEIRKLNSFVPLIFLTGEAKDVAYHKKAYQMLRAVNYIEKPIELDKLLEQCRGLLQPVGVSKYGKNGCQITINGQLLTINNRIFQFTEMEIKVFSLLLEKLDSPVSRKDILLKVWHKDEYQMNGLLNSTINRIKRKLKNFTGIKIETIYGEGYRMFFEENKQITQ